MRVSFAKKTVTIIRADRTEDRYGDSVLDWDNSSEHEVEKCILLPVEGEETLSLESDQVISRWTLDAPYDADITALDRVRYNDVTYEVDGSVQHWESPTGRLNHLEVMLKRLERS